MTNTFYFTNEYGQRFDLNSKTQGFLYEVSGMGFEMDSAYTKIGASWISNYRRDAQPNMGISVLFRTENAEQYYQAFCLYLRRSQRLTFVYNNGYSEFLRDVDLGGTEKSYLGAYALVCTVKLYGRSLWRKDTAVRVAIQDAGATDGKRYTYTLPYRYRDSAGGSVTLTNDGSVPAAISCVINGAVTNPTIALYQNGAELCRVDIVGEALSGEQIQYSSKDGDLYCRLIDTNGAETNLTPGLSLANANFYKIPVGTYQIRITADSQITEPIELTMQQEFRAV